MRRQSPGRCCSKPRGPTGCQPDLGSWEQGLGQTLPQSPGRDRPHLHIQPPDGETVQVCTESHLAVRLCPRSPEEGRRQVWGGWEACTKPLPGVTSCARRPDLLSDAGRVAHVLTLHWALITQAFLFSDLSGETPLQVQTPPRQPGPHSVRGQALGGPEAWPHGGPRAASRASHHLVSLKTSSGWDTPSTAQVVTPLGVHRGGGGGLIPGRSTKISYALHARPVAQSCPTPCDPMDCSPPGSSPPWDSPGKNTAVGCHAFLQGIFPTQGCSLRLLRGQEDSSLSEPPGRPLMHPEVRPKT